MSELTLQQLEDEIAERLHDQLREVDPDRRRTIVEACANDLASELDRATPRERRIDRDLFRHGRSYAVPDDELDLVPSLVSGAISIFTGAPAGVLPGLFAILRRYRKLRVALDGDEALVLRALKDAKKTDAGGLTAAQLGRRLSGETEIETKKVRRILRRLLEKSDRAGESVRLVETNNGRWWIGNV